MVRLILIIFSCVIFFSCNTEQRKKGEMNLQNIKRVSVGMDTLAVVKIMGKPDSRYIFRNEIFYDYVLTPNASGQLKISFDSLGNVIDKGNIPPE
jgi:outer membrane protein assembly factor BamE (lipoprotein component of BamABCDE complex)